MRRRAIFTALFVPLAAIAIVAGACEKDDRLVAQEQVRQSREACPQGCEEPLPGCEIKGNISAKGNRFYHLPGGKYYNGIIVQPEKGERWFCTEAEAVDNGFVKSAE